MRFLKTYWMVALATLFIVLGLAMPQIGAFIQNQQFEKQQQVFDLSAINLALQNEHDVLPVLQLVATEHTENPWEGEAFMTENEAKQAALTVMSSLDSYSLLPEGDLERYQTAHLEIKPNLFVDNDGNSALVWNCVWDCDSGTFITMDDATGKPVRILVNNALTDNASEETVETQLEKWRRFISDTYGLNGADIRENGSRSRSNTSGSFVVPLSSSENETTSVECNSNLEITDDYTFFNYR